VESELAVGKLYLAPGDWNKDTAGLGEITVGGRTFFPVQAGNRPCLNRTCVLARLGGNHAKHSGSRSTSFFCANPIEGAAERAYQQELARTAQLAAQDPELQRIKS
jgi:hypothetical protein